MPIMREFLRHPFLTGAVAPSSPQLARAMTERLGLESASVVVELGAGTGAITEAIVERINPRARLVVIELNRALADELAFRFRGQPVQVLHESAANLRRLVPWPIDVVVSGLPWTVMPAHQQRRTLDAIAGSLGPLGRFSTFAYVHAGWTPPARRFARELAQRFAVIEHSAVIWRNIPPAYVHRAAVSVKARQPVV
jgi:phospholipid N-methyltransferase